MKLTAFSLSRKTHVPREKHTPEIAAHCSSDRNKAEIKELGSFSLHGPDRPLYPAAEGTPSLPHREAESEAALTALPVLMSPLVVWERAALLNGGL